MRDCARPVRDRARPVRDCACTLQCAACRVHSHHNYDCLYTTTSSCLRYLDNNSSHTSLDSWTPGPFKMPEGGVITSMVFRLNEAKAEWERSHAGQNLRGKL